MRTTQQYSTRPAIAHAVWLVLGALALVVSSAACQTPGGGVDVPAGGRNEPTVAMDRGFAAAQRHIAQREYRASENGEELQAPNRVHNLRTYFEPTGIRVHDRTRAGSPELLALHLTGVGRGEAFARVGPGEVTSKDARVEINRPGLLEWYENSPVGSQYRSAAESLSFSLRSFDQSTANGRPNPDEESVSH